MLAASEMAPCLETKKWNGGCDDRFSDLPDGVIHHIFSFLDYNYMGTMSMLSKKFRQLCFSSPYLYVSLPMRGEPKPFCRKFSSFVDNFMSQRGDDAIHSFRLWWSGDKSDYGKEEKSRFDVWIPELANYNVQELRIGLYIYGLRDDYIYGRDIFPCPQPLFTCCKSLKVHELDLQYHGINLPMIILESLEVLSLAAGNLVCELPLGEWLSICCPSLRKLSLVPRFKLNTLENHTMEDLTIRLKGTANSEINILGNQLKTVCIEIPSLRSCRFKISAPIVEVLKWDGNPRSCIEQENFTSLSEAVINSARRNLDWSHSLSQSTFDRIISHLNSTSSARFLCIHICLAEILFVREQPPLLFQNVHQLDIIVDNWKYYHTAVIGTLISRMPNLRTLSIKRKPHYETKWSIMTEFLLRSKASTFGMGTESPQNTSFSPDLKEVQIQLSSFDEKDGGVELVKYFTTTLDSLEKMTIFYPSSLHVASTSFVENITAPSRITFVSQVKELDEEKKAGRLICEDCWFSEEEEVSPVRMPDFSNVTSDSSLTDSESEWERS